MYAVTALEIYEVCPWQYYLQFVRRLPPPGSAARAAGTTLHRLIADHLRRPQLLPATVPGEIEPQWERFLSSRFVGPPVLCEAPFRLTFARGDARGRIDLVMDGPDNGLEVVDFKGGQSRPRAVLDAALQLPLYAMAVGRRYDLPPERLSWTYVHLGDGVATSFSPGPGWAETLTARVDGIMAGIQAGEFPSAPGCDCWACRRFPPHSSDRPAGGEQ